jgi:diketogulonate reductase-like aldo/keto reductase
MESLYAEGRTKIIGVSNVSPAQLELLCDRATHRPMVVQNRCYAAFGWDRAVRELCRTHGILYQAFSLLTANREVFLDPTIRSIAEKYSTGVAQVIFRFAMQIGMVPLTGTSNSRHMAEDLQADRFTLTTVEVAHIETIGV